MSNTRAGEVVVGDGRGGKKVGDVHKKNDPPPMVVVSTRCVRQMMMMIELARLPIADCG